MPASVLVGCGGSGIHTLIRLNELLSEDPEWRTRVDNDIYYVVIDTDEHDLNLFRDRVWQQLGGVSKPVIKTIALAQNRPNLQPDVMRHFVYAFRDGKGTEGGRERLYEHWWRRGELQPFVAPRAIPLHDGAGQCPPASYFLTWLNLQTIEREFNDLVDEIVRRRAGQQGQDQRFVVEPLEELNFIIVAGLAGGTGRGCWELVAFKMRQLFERIGQVCSPVAFLFDAGTFENVMRKHPEQAVSMKVNALTGISELSCWIKNVRGGSADSQPFLYCLPNMEAPADDELDVLKASLGLNVNAAAPVDNAYLIFQRAGTVAVLERSDQYHEMVGAGLYAALTRSSIQQRRINDIMPYRSMGTATFEVNASTLRRYYEATARIKALQTLCTRDQAAIDREETDFLKRTRLLLGVTPRDRSGFRADPKGSFLQRVCQAVQDTYQAEMSSLVEALQADDVERVTGLVPAIVAEDAAKVAEAVRAAVTDMEVPPLAVAQELILKLCREVASVETVHGFVDEVTTDLQQTLDALPEKSQMRVEKRDNPVELAVSLANREFVLFGRHYNEQECEEIRNKTLNAILYANYGAIVDELAKRYREWMAGLARWRRNAEETKKSCEKVLRKLKAELHELGGEAEDLFDAFFTNVDAPETGIPEQAQASRFYRRELRPPMKRGQEAELLPKFELGQGLSGCLRSALIERQLASDAFDELDRLRKELEEHIRDEVRLEEGFIENNFSIRRVIGGLRRAWRLRLRNAAGTHDRFVELAERFHSFFGVTPTQEVDGVGLPDEDEFVLQMGTSLAATCGSFWQLQDGGKTLRDRDGLERRVALFLPPTEGRFNRDAAEAHVRAQLPADVVVEVFGERNVEGSTSNRPNPFVLLAYSSDGVDKEDIDQISSLGSWRTDARVQRWLERCEDPQGEAVFDETDNNKGMGFVEPIYIMNEQLSPLRWKPWLKARSDTQAETKATLDALLYALLEPTGRVKAELDKLGWDLPLLRDTGKERYALVRPAYRLDATGRPELDRTTWQANQPLCQSICQALDVLNGQGDRAGRLRNEGRHLRDRILQESRDFWDHVAVRIGCGAGTQDHQGLLREHEQRLGNLRDSAEADDRSTWDRLIARVVELRKP